MALRNIFLSATAGFVMSSAAFAQDVTTDTVLATVGDTKITVANLIDVKRQLPQQYQTLPDDVLMQGILDQVIQQTLLMDTLADAPAWLETAMENERRNVLAAVVIDAVRATAVTPETVAAAYSAKYETGSGEQEYNASHILVETEEKAKDLIAQINDGADFAEMAAEHSTGPSGPNGGQLGWFGTGRMVPEFEAAVVAMDVGAVSGPVQTQFGWHIIKLNDARAVMPPPLDAVRGEIELELQNAAVEARIAQLMADANITRPGDNIDPSFLSTLTVDDIK